MDAVLNRSLQAGLAGGKMQAGVHSRKISRPETGAPAGKKTGDEEQSGQKRELLFQSHGWKGKK
jgi:hypothetical protein